MEGKKKISTLTAGALLCVAALFEVLQVFLFLIGLIPVVGQVLAVGLAIPIGMMAYTTFWLWFGLLGVDFFSFKKPAKFFTRFGTFAAECVPYISSILPMIFFSVLLSIHEANKEAKNTNMNDSPSTEDFS